MNNLHFLREKKKKALKSHDVYPKTLTEVGEICSVSVVQLGEVEATFIVHDP